MTRNAAKRKKEKEGKDMVKKEKKERGRGGNEIKGYGRKET